MARQRKPAQGKAQPTLSTNEVERRAQFRRDMVFNIMTTRRQLLTQMLDPRRSIEQECGYPDTYSVTPQDYQNLFDRHPIAGKVVEYFPNECWQIQPTVYEDESSDTVTPFEKAWDSLPEHLNGEKSWYQDEQGNVIWSNLKLLDVVSRIAHYGVMLIGIDDGRKLHEPADMNAVFGKKLIYLRCFSEALAQVTASDARRSSPRYSQPERYLITFNDPSEQVSGIGLSTSTQEVHWTRIHHVADNIQSNPIYGVPAMRPVLNTLLDLKKVYSSDAEAYWKNCLIKLMLESHPQLGAELDVDIDEIKGDIEDFSNGVQPYLALMGLSGKTVAPSVVDLSPHIDKQIEAICIKLDIPKRILMGSERGELSSAQDQKGWNKRVKGRNDTHTTPRIIAPFANRLISLGVLPRPKGFSVWWPDLNSVTDAERAPVALQQTQALAAFIAGNVQSLLTPLDFFVKFLGLDEEEAQTMLNNTLAMIKGTTQPQAVPPSPVATPPASGGSSATEQPPSPFIAEDKTQRMNNGTGSLVGASRDAAGAVNGRSGGTGH